MQKTQPVRKLSILLRFMQQIMEVRTSLKADKRSQVIMTYVGPTHCGQIWQNFATLEQFEKYFAIF